MTASDRTRTVVLIAASPAERERVTRLTRASSVRVQYCRGADDVAAAASRCAAVAVIAAACDESGISIAPALQRLRRLVPSVAIILLLHPRCASPVALAALRIADDVIFDGEMSEGSLWSAINRAAVRRPAAALKRRATPVPPFDTNESRRS